jgi:hypothetical protein
MFDFGFWKFFENNLTIFKFFSLFQINIFVIFLNVFKKYMLRLCLAALAPAFQHDPTVLAPYSQ